MFELVEFGTKNAVTPTDLVFSGADQPWEVQINLAKARKRINLDYLREAPARVSKYLPLLPIGDCSQFVSLAEGGTPLIKARLVGRDRGIHISFKLELSNPTGSFKDRGSAVDITVARERGAKAIVLASTGNMAASCACYAAAAELPCYVFVSEETPASKLAQVIAYGGKIIQVKGGYNDAAQLAEQAARELGFYLAGDYAFRVEGQKTAAYELCEQLRFNTPDYVVVPVGCGTNFAAYAKGFREYYELGLIERLPKLVAVQASGAASIVRAFEDGGRLVPLKSVDTLATAIAVTRPLDGVKVLRGLEEFGGYAIEVSDQEMREALLTLSSKEGLFIELSSAAAFAAVSKLEKLEDLRGKRVVCVLTGHGLKDTNPVIKAAIRPPTIAPDLAQFLRLYGEGLFEGKSISFVDRQKVLFNEEPSLADIRTHAEAVFGPGFGEKYYETMRQAVVRFLDKGKPVTAADFQDIVDTILHALRQPAPQLVVEDFEVRTGRNRRAEARVRVTLDGLKRESDAAGVGPVNAVIKALMKAGDEHKLQTQLVDYRADIRSPGTDAVVNVELKLQRNGSVSVGTGTSPDIVQASIEAFCGAYNGL